jgi:hypothetical protein
MKESKPTVTMISISENADVAQVSNLLYRGFPIRNGHHARTVSRLEVGDTAGWKPALRERRADTSPNLRPRDLRLEPAARSGKEPGTGEFEIEEFTAS